MKNQISIPGIIAALIVLTVFIAALLTQDLSQFSLIK